MNPKHKTIRIAAIAAISTTIAFSAQANAEDAKPLPKHIVKKFDADKNGKLEGEEVKALLAAVDANKKEIEAAMIKRFDKDGDGKLSEKEAKKAKKAVRDEAKEIKAATLKKFDKDADGKISGAERKGMKKWLKETYPDAIPKEIINPKYKLPTP